MTPSDHNHTRVTDVRPLVAPTELRRALPLTSLAHDVVHRGREAITNVLNGNDDRLLVIVGPCSIHDPTAAREYARRLASLADRVARDLCVVMRAYFEKPRTTIGWKGLINDPRLDGSFEMSEGLSSARSLLRDIVSLGLPVACEFLDPVMPQYIEDSVSWAAIGARTVQSQIHRQLASGLAMPVGFKNSTDGDMQGAVDAVCAASTPQCFSSVDESGRLALISTAGNTDCHVVLRGGSTGPNFDERSVGELLDRLGMAGLPKRLVIDASHDNSGKDHHSQEIVAHNVATRVALGYEPIVGVMLESFLVAGRQSVTLGKTEELVYGQSITDACMGWPTTEDILTMFADAVACRRSASRGLPSLSLT